MTHPYQRRLLKEFRSAKTSELPGVTFLEDESSTELYYYTMTIAQHPLYAEQEFTLRIAITKDYPVDSPQVTFVEEGESVIPMHPHIYSNGHICLNLLGNDWTPACGLETIVLSIQSMLGNNTVAERPPDDDQYVRSGPKDPKKTSFVYHDDSV